MLDSAQTSSKQCPACDSPLDDQQYAEVEAKLRDSVKRSVEVERRKLDEQYRRDTEAFQKAAHKKATQRAEAIIAEAAKERDAAVEKAKGIEQQAEAREKEIVKVEVAKARDSLEREHERVLTEKAAEIARERESFQRKMADLQRQLARKTANELGDGAEINLYETLKGLFPEDHITRIKKGEPGADIKVEVRHRGDLCGIILLDSKNRKNWKHEYATKLRKDQVEAKADHAILSTTVFPKGKKELCVEADVLVAGPGRVPELVHILREEVIKCHRLGLSNRERAGKREALYRYITSETFRLKMAEVRRLNENMQELDVQEQRQQKKIREKRGTMLKQQEHALLDIEVEVGGIIQGHSDEVEV